MSNEMLNLAWETEVATPAMKCVLIALADHHNINTELCCPSISRLARRTCMNRQSVVNNTKRLEKVGLISVKRDGGNGSGARPNQYTFNLGQSRVNRPGKVSQLDHPKVHETDHPKVYEIDQQSTVNRLAKSMK